MGKSTVFQALALMLFLLGGYILYEGISNEKEAPTLLSGIATIIMGIALLILSRSKAIKGN